MRRILLGAAALGTVLVAAPASAPARTVDQQQTSSTNNAALTSDQSIAQTFTAGMSGVLDQADLVLSTFGSPPASVTVEIRDTSAGAPGTAVLGTATIPTSSIAATKAFVPALFPTPVPISAGTKYAIVAYSPGTSPNDVGAWYQNPPSVYAGGSGFYTMTSSPPGAPWIDQMGDYAFRTYVAPAPPPASTGQRAAALKKCQKRHSARARRKCRRKAKQLPL